MRPRSIHEQDVMRDFEEECEEKVTNEDRGQVLWKRQGQRERRKRRTCKQKGKIQVKRSSEEVNDDDEGEEADEAKEGTRKPRWAACEEEEEARQGAS